MNKNKHLEDKVKQLNDQIELLTKTLGAMTDKMTVIENTTLQIRKEIRNEISELKEQIDHDIRKT